MVEGRLTEMYMDTLDLYGKAYSTPSPSLAKGTGSWTGHVQQVGGWQRRLRNLVDEATALGCKVPPHARNLAYAPIPSRPGKK